MKASSLLPAALIVGSLAYGAGAIAGTYGGTFGNGGAAGGGGGGSGDITDVGSCSTGACFSSASADDTWLGLGASAGRIEFDDQTVDEVNIVGAYHGVNTQTPAHWEHIAGGTLASGVRALYVSGTLPDVNGSRAAEFVTTSSGAGSNSQYGILYTMAAGGTGTNTYVGVLSSNSAAGTGTHNPLAGTDFANGANLGVWGQSDATTAGTNVGLLGRTVNGAIATGVWGTAGVAAAGYRQDSANYGVVGTVVYAKNAGSTTEKHVGVVGFGEGGDLNVGGYFGLTAGTPTFVSSALIADNGTAASNIFTARDNGTTVFTIADSGTTTAAQQFVATKDPSSTGASNASMYVNPATSASNEMLIALADNGTAVFSIDKEGDVDVRTMANSAAGTCFTGVTGAVCITDIAAIAPAAGDGVLHAKAGSNTSAAGVGLWNSTSTSVGTLAYFDSSAADADYADKVVIRGISKMVSIARTDDVAAGTAALEVRDNASATGVQLLTVDGNGNIFVNAAGTRTKGTITLAAGTGTATVASGSICVCSDTTAINAVQCSVTTTTLTANGTGTDVIAYHCL